MTATQLEMLMTDEVNSWPPLVRRPRNALMTKKGAMALTLNTSTQLSIVSTSNGSVLLKNAVIFLLKKSGSVTE